jgi:hypothetical protein
MSNRGGAPSRAIVPDHPAYGREGKNPDAPVSPDGHVFKAPERARSLGLETLKRSRRIAGVFQFPA